MLERSGEVYSPGTAQYRFLRLHFVTKEIARDAWEHWSALRSLDLFAATAAPVMATDQRTQYINESLETLDNILNSVHPFSALKQEYKARPKASDEDKAKYINLLSKVKMHSMQDVASAMKALNQYLQESKNAHAN